MYSGISGAVLFTFVGDHKGDLFGSSVAVLGDLDHDGYPELAVGAPQNHPQVGAGYVKVFSGKTGQALATIPGTAVGDDFGSAIAGAGDLDGDGTPDLWIGAPQVAGRGPGFAVALSGKTGSPLRVLTGRAALDAFGASIAGGRDVDGDGTPDAWIGAPGDDRAALDAGSCTLVSGKTRAVVWIATGAAGDRFGAAVALAGDVDGDGVVDLLSGAPGMANTGAVVVLSGKARAPLYTLAGQKTGEAFGATVAPLGDIDRDGRADFVAGAPNLDTAALDVGAARVFSGAAQTLWSDVHQLGLKTSGRQQLTVDVGSAHAGRGYQLFGCISGAHPGVVVQHLPILLNIDWYTEVTMAGANTGPFVGFRGTLDAAGRATAAVVLPASLPVLPDFTLWHVAVVFDAAGLRFATNPTTLRLVH